MKAIKELVVRGGVPQPEFENHSASAVRLLYVAPFVNAEGYYRMLLPYLELGKTSYFETRVTSVKKWDFTQGYTISPETFREEDVQWADYIIFPVLLEAYGYLFKALRVLNPDVYLLMDVTRMIPKLPRTHPDYGKFTTDQKRYFFSNIYSMNGITTPVKAIAELFHGYKAYGDERLKEVDVFWLPTLISTLGYEEVTETKQRNKEVVRIGMIGSSRWMKQYRYLLPVLEKVEKTYGNLMEIHLFGWDGKDQGGEMALGTLPVTYHKSVSFLEYFQRLQDLELDVLLIPMQPSEYNHFTDTTRFLEAAAIGVPVIAPENSAYKLIIQDGVTGLLADKFKDWEAALIRLLEHPEFREELGANARAWVWNYRSYHPKTITLFRELFI